MQITRRLRDICQDLGNSMSYTQAIDNSWDKIFKFYGDNDFSFPIYDENHRAELCKKILRQYYMRQIAYETTSLFLMKLNTRMSIIMPYYNELYKTLDIEYNPLSNYNYVRETVENTSENGVETGKKVSDIKGSSTDNITENETGKQTMQQSGNTSSDSVKSETGELKKTTSSSDNVTTSEDGTTTTQRDITIANNSSSENSRDLTSKGTSSSSTDTESSETKATSDTPQGKLTNVKNYEYLTEAVFDTKNENTTQTGTTSQTDNETSNGTATMNGKTDDDSTVTLKTNGSSDSVKSGTETDKNTVNVTENITGTSSINGTTDTTRNNKIGKESSSSTVGNETNTLNTDNQKHRGAKETEKGYRGVNPTQLMLEYRQSIMNIDSLIIDELEDLFLLIW